MLQLILISQTYFKWIFECTGILWQHYMSMMLQYLIYRIIKSTCMFESFSNSKVAKPLCNTYFYTSEIVSNQLLSLYVSTRNNLPKYVSPTYAVCTVILRVKFQVGVGRAFSLSEFHVLWLVSHNICCFFRRNNYIVLQFYASSIISLKCHKILIIGKW